jgi:hypothetical protein
LVEVELETISFSLRASLSPEEARELGLALVEAAGALGVLDETR